MHRAVALVLVSMGACIDNPCTSITGGCGDDLIQALCLNKGLGDIIRVHDQVIAILDSIGGPPPANVTLDIATGAYSVTMTIGTVTGVISSPDDLGNGLAPGEEATATWALNGGFPGTARAGEGSFTFIKSASGGYAVTGSGSIVDEDCEVDTISLDVANSSAATFGSGTLDFNARSSAGSMQGTVTFDGAGDAEIVGEFQGDPVVWGFDPETGSVFFPP